MVNQTYGQKEIIRSMNVDSLNNIEEVVIVGYSNLKLDTVGLDILYVFEMERTNPNFKKNESCDSNDFIVMYDNYSCIYFSMGCAWSCEKLFWAEKNDTTFFYSGQNIENEMRRNKLDKNQIGNYLNKNGKRIHIGSIKYGFDYLVRNSKDYYTPCTFTGIMDNYIFMKEENIRECHQTYYNSIIKEN